MLLGSLTTYELEMKRKKKKKDDEEGARKKKALALRASSPPTTDSEGDSSKDDEEKLEDEIALVSRRFNSLMKKKKQLFRRSQRKPFKAKDAKENTSKIKENEVTCYNCNQPGHIKPNCPLLKGKKIRKKKAFVATWSDSDENSSSDEKEETANLCLMADVESDDDGSTNSVNDSSLSYDELEENLVDLIQEYDKLKKKYFSLKKAHLSCDSLANELKRKISDLTDLNKDLCMRIDEIIKENEFLKIKNKLHDPKTKKHAGICSKNSHLNVMPNIICNFCQKHGHIARTCRIRKSMLASKCTSYVWIPKCISYDNHTTLTNPLGPKFIWAPKIKT
ncbi:hypothetical protein AXF42_Ash019517 [Apostasia shenzhenica]|uniref:CCHC-type domain-containing protein n=1 Tax=Apostasia shenzhenica TaxID=1088818 RepID=A0A2I0A0B2_9ASPA|nr:hypothetical protein AXF42_Ash019517 [Apostasia shenzhenica]